MKGRKLKGWEIALIVIFVTIIVVLIIILPIILIKNNDNNSSEPFSSLEPISSSLEPISSSPEPPIDEVNYFGYLDYIPELDSKGIEVILTNMVDQGFTHIILFAVSSLIKPNEFATLPFCNNELDFPPEDVPIGIAGSLAYWYLLTPSERSIIKNKLYGRGLKKLLLGFGGGSDQSWGYFESGNILGDGLSCLINYFDLDGIDLDLEGIQNDFSAPPIQGVTKPQIKGKQMVKYISDIMKRLKFNIKSILITTAPQPLYFALGCNCGDNSTKNGYVSVCEEAGDALDFVLTQFYNQTDNPNDCTSFTNYDFLFNPNDLSTCYNYSQLIKLKGDLNIGIPINKMIVGKPVSPNNPFSFSLGYVNPIELSSMLCNAKKNFKDFIENYNINLMLYAYNESSNSSDGPKFLPNFINSLKKNCFT